MSRRTSVPGADELFRTTADLLSQPAPAGPLRSVAADADEVETRSVGVRRTAPHRHGRQAGDRPSGRERHDEKITVYVSADELLELEQARLTLRGEHGMAVDRGRIVREALAVVLADLDANGEASVLVRRLRGR